MAGYFAKIENNIVQQVISATDAQWCVDNLGGEWVQTYYSTPGKNYAGIGHIYVPQLENFHSEQPYNSWYLDSNLQWQPPVEMPQDGKMYRWVEDTQKWVEITFN